MATGVGRCAVSHSPPAACRLSMASGDSKGASTKAIHHHLLSPYAVSTTWITHTSTFFSSNIQFSQWQHNWLLGIHMCAWSVHPQKCWACIQASGVLDPAVPCVLLVSLCRPIPIYSQTRGGYWMANGVVEVLWVSWWFLLWCAQWPQTQHNIICEHDIILKVHGNVACYVLGTSRPLFCINLAWSEDTDNKIIVADLPLRIFPAPMWLFLAPKLLLWSLSLNCSFAWTDGCTEKRVSLYPQAKGSRGYVLPAQKECFDLVYLVRAWCLV